MASLDDILTVQKNGVVAINNLKTNFLYIGNTIAAIYQYMKGTPLASGAAVTGGYATVYTVPTGQQVAIVDMEICNTASTSATFYISLVPPGGTAGASNAVFYAAPINPNTTVQWTGQQVLAAGGKIAAYASATTVTFKFDGGPGA